MRTLSAWIVSFVLAASSAQAGISIYPPSYHSSGGDYYESLRIAKIAWLKANLAAVNSELGAHRSERLSAQLSQIEAELKVMSGARHRRQEALLKSNVQSWIGAARRNGNGAEAIWLMHDLEGSGL